MQTTFHYDYGSEKYAVKQAKKLRGQSVYVWVIQSPKDKRYKVLEGESIEDRPTRVLVLWEHYSPPPRAREIDSRIADRDNLIWLANLAHQNDDNNELAQAVLSYLENYDS